MSQKFALLTLLALVSVCLVQGQEIARAPLINGVLYLDGVKYNGSVDIGATLNRMIDSLPTVNGYRAGKIIIPCGAYPLRSTVEWSSPYLSIEGTGSACTIINSLVNGDAFRIQSVPFTVLQAGGLRYITINGNSQANAVGVHLGDIIGFDLFDVVIHAFQGSNSAGLWMDNVRAFTERTLLTKVHLDYNTKDWRFTNATGSIKQSSFGYTKALDVRMNIQSYQTGISFESGTLYNSILNVNTNATGMGSTVIKISGLQYKGAGGSAMQDNSGSFVAEISPPDTGTFANIGPGTSFRFMGDLVQFNFTNTIKGTYQTPIASNAGTTPFYQYFSNTQGFGNFYYYNYTNPSASRTLRIDDPGGDDTFVFANAKQSLSGKRFIGSIPAGDRLYGIGATLLADAGPAGGRLEGLGLNLNWDGANYLLNGNGLRNGGQAILGSVDISQIGFYVIPSTGGSDQRLGPSNLAEYLVGKIDSRGDAAFEGEITAKSVRTAGNCSSSVSPALCGSAAAGSVAIAAGSSSTSVQTTAVTADSQILITFDSSLGERLSLICNTTLQQPYVTARVPGRGFTISVLQNFQANPGCLSYEIVN